jgi:hypothetical protein
MAKILRCVDAENDLKLIHQNYRRTVPTPPPYPEFVGDGEPGLGRHILGSDINFHMDSAFLPRHYATTPRQNYYIALTALSPMVSGGAAFVFARGSLAAAKRAGASLPAATSTAVNGATCRTDLPYLLGQGVRGVAIMRLSQPYNVFL